MNPTLEISPRIIEQINAEPEEEEVYWFVWDVLSHEYWSNADNSFICAYESEDDAKQSAEKLNGKLSEWDGSTYAGIPKLASVASVMQQDSHTANPCTLGVGLFDHDDNFIRVLA